MKSVWVNFVRRFVIVHVITYLLFGVFFMVVSQYFDYFQSHDLFKDFMRPADSLIVRLAVVLQIFRGALLGLALYPFRSVIIGEGQGWLKLFAVMWVLTGVGAVVTGPGSIEGFIYTKFGFGNPLIGLPEITLQMLAFSWIFARWEKKSA